jgi:flagellar FliL protein
MSQAESDNDSDEGAEAGAAGKGGRKKLVLIVAAAVLLLAAAAAAFFLGLFGGDAEPAAAPAAGDAAAAAGGPAPPPVFHALPDLVVTLNTGDRKTRYLKAHVVVELAAAADQAQIDLMAPRILDYCQIFLRELRPDELRGSAAIVRMREELLKRINAAVAPVTVRDVLFAELYIE